MADEFRSERKAQLEQATRGDPGALGELLEEYVPRVQAFVRLRMGAGLRAHESSVDLVQGVCVDLLRRQEQFEYRGEAEFRSWLFRAALNKIRERQRFWLRDRRDARREQGAPPSADSTRLEEVYRSFATPSQDLMSHEHIARLEAAFDRLPEHYREVITLARVVGLPHDAIAEQMGKSVGAVRQMLGRALLQLAEFMA
ncbi:MAG: sigma-70 family RNA polymerase sigma factor [Planctomycetes bacterium]|nr:sigma-70 family RNA polymerase sigma factor [Planctomycetota bacterium]